MRDRVLKYVLILPAALIVVGTTIWPLGVSLLTSVRDWRLARSLTPGGFVGVEHYIIAFTDDPDFSNALAVTARVVALDVPLTVLSAVGLALLLRRAGVLQSVTRAVLILPFAVSPALVGISFRFMFNAESGVLSWAAGSVTAPLRCSAAGRPCGRAGRAGALRCLALGALHDVGDPGWPGGAAA